MQVTGLNNRELEYLNQWERQTPRHKFALLTTYLQCRQPELGGSSGIATTPNGFEKENEDADFNFPAKTRIFRAKTSANNSIDK